MTAENDFDLYEQLNVITPTPLVTFLHSSSPLSSEALSDPESVGMRLAISPSTPTSGPIFTVSTKRMRYQAAPLEEPFSPYYIAARDRETGKLRLVPTKIYQLSPQITPRDNIPSTSSEEKETLTYQEKRAELTRAFGSSKAKRKLASAELAKNDPALLADTIGLTLSSVKEVEIEKVEEAPSSLLLPPHHSEGKQPADIFLLEELLGEGVLNSVSSHAREIRGASAQQLAQWGAEDRYGEYALSWLSEPRLAQLREHSRYHYKPLLKALVCLHFLICFYLIPTHKKHKSRPLPEEIDFYPVELKEFCLSCFSEQSLGTCDETVYSLSRRVKDKLLLYILALALILEDYKMDASALVSNLNIQPLSARKYFISVGCKFVSNFPKKRKLTNGVETDNSMKVYLVAPLELPKKSFYRK